MGGRAGVRAGTDLRASAQQPSTRLPAHFGNPGRFGHVEHRLVDRLALAGVELAFGGDHLERIDDAFAGIAQHDQDRRHGAALGADVGHLAARAEEFGAVGQRAPIKPVGREIQLKVSLPFSKGLAGER